MEDSPAERASHKIERLAQGVHSVENPPARLTPDGEASEGKRAASSLDRSPSAEPGADLTEPVDSELLSAWFDQLYRMLPKPGAGVIIGIEAGQCGPLLVSRLKRNKAPKYLMEVADKVIATGAPLKRSGVFGHPLRRHGEAFAVVAISLKVGKAQQDVVLHLLDWAERWLQLLLDLKPAVDHSAAPHLRRDSHSDMLRAVLATSPLDAALLTLADRLARRYACDQVAVGLRDGKSVRLRALSQGVQFDRRTRRAKTLEETMTRAAAGGCRTWPEDSDDGEQPLRALTEFTGDQSLLASAVGDSAAVILERPADRPFTAEEQEDLQALGGLLGPVIALKRDQSALMPPRVRQSSEALLDRLLKPGHRKFKLAAGMLAALLLVLVFAEGTFRVKADANIEGLVQRAVVAPFDGFIAEAGYRAGDRVTSGDVIARMEDRELLLELRKSTSEEEKLENEYRKALASADRSEALVAQARLSQVQSQSRLLREKLKRIELSAPVDGVVISGDLSHALGSPVERGDVLFEVAPLDEYRLVLEIDEGDIAHVSVGQRGRLTLTALPNDPLDFVVERVSPVFLEKEGRVVYRTEAHIEGDASILRPGMEGIGKVDAGERSYGWILFHRLGDWLRLKLWQWLP